MFRLGTATLLRDFMIRFELTGFAPGVPDARTRAARRVPAGVGARPIRFERTDLW